MGLNCWLLIHYGHSSLYKPLDSNVSVGSGNSVMGTGALTFTSAWHIGSEHEYPLQKGVRAAQSQVVQQFWSHFGTAQAICSFSRCSKSLT